MYKLSQKLPISFRLLGNVRDNSSYNVNSQQRKIKTFGLVGSGAAVAISSVLGYAYWNQDFRSTLKHYVPQLSILFEDSDKTTSDTSKLPVIPTSTLQLMNDSSISSPSPPLPPIEKPQAKLSPTSSSNFETKLKKSINKLKSSVENVRKSTILVIQEHSSRMKQVLEQGGQTDEKACNSVFEAAIAETNNAFANAKKIMDSVTKEISEGRLNNEQELILDNGNEEIQKCKVLLEDNRKALKKVLMESKKQYQDSVDEAKEYFNKELASLLPEFNGSRQNLSEDEINLLIQYSYNKIDALQKELAKEKISTEEKIQKALENDKSNVRHSISMDLYHQKRDLEEEFANRIASVREDMEQDLRRQMKRQIAAHSDHISELKNIYEHEFDRKLKSHTNKIIENEILKRQSELIQISASYEGIISALEKRSNADKNISKVQHFWLAISGLYEASTKTSESFIQELNYVKSISDDKDHFITTLLGEMSNIINKTNGLMMSEESLKDRFLKVERVVQETDLIGEKGAPLLTYALSYIKSKLTMIPNGEIMPSKEETLDIEHLSTFEIVWLAKGSLLRGDLEQSVKYMTLLKGESLHVATDWINDARSLLELRQACDALLVYASAICVEFLPKPEGK